ncbi:MAG TPA: urease accessory protein UreD [Burkholderiales bacterium]|jgi:urease accessory protein|nr:urease accessory protein UreD [Burkholderiales bacterium]
MQVVEPVARSWQASLSLGFEFRDGKTVLAKKSHDGPLVVQKPLYPEGGEVCHAIVVHPPGGIAGGDELALEVETGKQASALLTTPGATKWYRSAGPIARQAISLEVAGSLEWLPQETIVFDGARAELDFRADLAPGAVLLGWDLVCLGRTGSGERLRRGGYRFSTQVRRDGRLLWQERGRIEGGARLLDSPAGLAGKPVFGTLFFSGPLPEKELLEQFRQIVPEEGEGAMTLLPGILLARYLGESTEAGKRWFAALWRALRPALCGRAAVEPRIWHT